MRRSATSGAIIGDVLRSPVDMGRTIATRRLRVFAHRNEFSPLATQRRREKREDRDAGKPKINDGGKVE